MLKEFAVKFFDVDNTNHCFKDILIKAFAVLCLASFTVAASAQESLQFNVRSFEVEGDNPISSAQSQSILNKFIGQQSGLEGLNAARDELEQALAQKGFPFYRVTLPPQELFDGLVKFKIVQFKLGNIIVEGNKLFSIENIQRSVPTLIKEKSPNTQNISKSLIIANENPAKNVSLSFKAGEIAEHIDAVLKVTEQNPQTMYVQLNNSGADDGEEFRVSFGYQHNSLWDKDHGMSFSYTTAPENTGAVSQWGLTYRMPLYQHGASLSFLYSDSEIDSGTVADSFEVSGSGSVMSVDYKRPLSRNGNYSHNFKVGLAIKTFDNNVSFFGTAIGTDVKTQPITAEYNGSTVNPSGQLSFNVGTAMNISGGSGNEDADYDSVRAEAKADWSTFYFGVNYIHRFANNTLMNVKFSAQQSGDLLVSGEQFGIGGAQSVRGYDERSVSGDFGHKLNLEYWFKPLPFYAIKPFVFYDMGTVETNKTSTLAASSQSISGAGIGLRYHWKEKVSVNLDYALALEETDITEDGDAKAHLSVFVRF